MALWWTAIVNLYAAWALSLIFQWLNCRPTTDQSNYCPMAESFPDEDIKPFVPKRGYPDYHPLDLRLQAVQRLQAPPSSCFQDNHYQYLPEAPFRESSKPVDFLNVKGVYEKIQCRKNKQSKQRLAGATIDMMATFSKQIRHVEVCVQRCAKAAALCGDSNGEVPLKPKIEGCHLTEVRSGVVVVETLWAAPKCQDVVSKSDLPDEKGNKKIHKRV